MTAEPASAGQRTADVLITGLDRPFTEMTVDELMALKAEFEARGIAIYNGATTDALILAAMIAPYTKAFLETLGKNNADALSGAVRARIRKRRKARELLVGTGGDAAATLVITSNTPDEARLALLDLDVTAEDLRGKRLSWDAETGRWQPCGETGEGSG